MADVSKLIAKAKAGLAVQSVHDLDVVIAGEKVKLGFAKASPDEWDLLVVSNPPRPGVEGDSRLGYNPKRVSVGYPNVELDGEVLDAEVWAELYSVIESVWRNMIELTIWGINVNDQLQVLRAVGKVLAGQESSLPAN